MIAANKEIPLLSDKARTTLHVATPAANQIIQPAPNSTEARDHRKDNEVLRQQDLVENFSRSVATSIDGDITRYPITQVRQEESRNQ
jgi:hypothetical protein